MTDRLTNDHSYKTGGRPKCEFRTQIYMHFTTRDGKEPSLLGFGSVRVLQPSVLKCQFSCTAKLHTPQKKTFVQFPPLQLRRSFSSPALSTPVISSVNWQSVIFYPYDFVRHLPVLHFPVLQIQFTQSQLGWLNLPHLPIGPTIPLPVTAKQRVVITESLGDVSKSSFS